MRRKSNLFESFASSMHQVSVHYQQDCFLSLMKGKRAFYSKINPVPIPFLHSIERAANHCIVPVHWRDFKEESRRVPLSAADVKEPLNMALAKGELQGCIFAPITGILKSDKTQGSSSYSCFCENGMTSPTTNLLQQGYAMHAYTRI